jgi:ribonuclease VapC
VTEAVLDASALLAFLLNEPGGSKVAAVITRSCISAVNLGEVISKMVQYGRPLDAVAYQIERLQIPVIPFDAEQAKVLASLWKASRAAGLSLADRACLGLGMQRQLPVMTTDRQWLKADVGAKVELIR